MDGKSGIKPKEILRKNFNYGSWLYSNYKIEFQKEFEICLNVKELWED